MHPAKLHEAITHLEAASAALLQVVITSKNTEPLLALALTPIVEVIGPLAARIQLIKEATESTDKPAEITSH